jgi:hypothetical protein
MITASVSNDRHGQEILRTNVCGPSGVKDLIAAANLMNEREGNSGVK